MHDKKETGTGISKEAKNINVKNGIVRLMKTEDIKEVCNIEKTSFSNPMSEVDLEKALKNKLSIFFVYEYNGQILGYLGAYYIGLGVLKKNDREIKIEYPNEFERDNSQVDIDNVAVDKEYRGLGIGSRILAAFKDTAENNSINRIFLEVRKSNKAAIGLYEKYGFNIESVRKEYYSDPTEDGYIMIRIKE